MHSALYKNSYLHNLLLDNTILKCDCKLTDNRPMNERPIKIYSGLDNIVKFQVFDMDRKKTAINGVEVIARLVSVKSKEVVLAKQAKVLASEKGRIDLAIGAADTASVPPGFYNLFVEAIDSLYPGSSYNSILYTDTAASASLPVEVIEKVHPSVSNVYKVSDFILAIRDFGTIVPMADFYSTNAMRVKTHVKDHSIQLGFENADNPLLGFSGYITVEASVSVAPPSNTDWFPIIPSVTGAVAAPGPISGFLSLTNQIDPVLLTFEASVSWVRFTFVRKNNDILTDGTVTHLYFV